MDRRNNFDAVRLIAALSVLFTHAFVVAEGGQQNEPFVILSGYQCPIGLIGVFMFFIVSGYLVTQSWETTPSPWRFAAKRGLRIFPGLFASLLVSGLVIGPLVSSLPLREYLADPHLLRFLGRNALLELGDNPLPGVLFSHNEAGDVVNGSLWTLRYEVMMYVMVAALGAAGLLRLPVLLALFALGIVALLFEHLLDPFGDLGEWAWFVGFFAAGMLLHRLRDRPIWRWQIALAAAIGLVVATRLHLLIALFPLFGGYLTIYVARLHAAWLDPLSRAGDLSYGAYIYGWPVEQCVVHAYGGTARWWQVLLWSVPISLALAALSWHGIEKWAVRPCAWQAPCAGRHSSGGGRARHRLNEFSPQACGKRFALLHSLRMLFRIRFRPGERWREAGQHNSSYGTVIRLSSRSISVLASAVLAGVPFAARAEVTYDTHFTGVDDAIESDLETASQLVTLVDKHPDSLSALKRRADTDLERLRQVMLSDGYYDAGLTVAVEPAKDPDDYLVTVTIEPGTVYTLADVVVRQEDGTPPPLPELTTPEAIGLKLGATALAAPVAAAESRIAHAYALKGWPYAKVTRREVEIDIATKTMHVVYILTPGPRANFGATAIDGLTRLDPLYAERRVKWLPGESYDQSKIDDTRQALVTTGLFGSVTVAPEGAVNADGTVPIDINLTERPLRTVAAGGSYDTSLGIEANASWEHRDLFGYAEDLTFTAKGGQSDSSINAKFVRPDMVWVDQDFVASAHLLERDGRRVPQHRPADPDRFPAAFQPDAHRRLFGPGGACAHRREGRFPGLYAGRAAALSARQRERRSPQSHARLAGRASR